MRFGDLAGERAPVRSLTRLMNCFQAKKALKQTTKGLPVVEKIERSPMEMGASGARRATGAVQYPIQTRDSRLYRVVREKSVWKSCPTASATLIKLGVLFVDEPIRTVWRSTGTEYCMESMKPTVTLFSSSER